MDRVLLALSHAHLILSIPALLCLDHQGLQLELQVVHLFTQLMNFRILLLGRTFLIDPLLEVLSQKAKGLLALLIDLHVGQ